MKLLILVGMTFFLFFSKTDSCAQTISASTTSGFYGSVVGGIANQTVVSLGAVQEVVVYDSVGRPAANVKVRFTAVSRDWSVLFAGQSFFDTITDVNGVAKATSMTPVVKESALQVDRFGTSYGSANVLVSLIDTPSVFVYLRGAIRANEPWFTSYGGFDPIPSARVKLEVVAPGVVRVTSDSPTPLRGVDLVDGTLIIARIPSLLGAVEIRIPVGAVSLAADYGGGWEYRFGGSNTLTQKELEGVPVQVPSQSSIPWGFVLLALLGCWKISRRSVRSP
jgi:hypothetical protein